MKICLKIGLKQSRIFTIEICKVSISSFEATLFFLLWRTKMEMCELKPTGQLQTRTEPKYEKPQKYSCAFAGTWTGHRPLWEGVCHVQLGWVCMT